MTLIVVRPWMVAKVVFVVDSFGKVEILADGIRSDTSISETGNRNLALFELGTKRSKQSTSLGRRVARPAVRLPDVSISFPIWHEFSSQDVLYAHCLSAIERAAIGGHLQEALAVRLE